MKLRHFALIGIAIVAALALTACDSASPSARQIEQAKAQQSQAILNKTDPIPVLPLSQERHNLVKRATRINVQNMNSCITLFTQSGAVVGTFNVDGKVSSLNSYLLSSEQIVDDPYHISTGSLVIEQPDIDGAYGKNADGVFFFEAGTDAYIEWVGDYFWSDQCLATSAPSLLIQNPPAN